MKSILLSVKNLEKTSKVFALVERDKKRAVVLVIRALLWSYSELMRSSIADQ